jgi:hypothetical protein
MILLYVYLLYVRFICLKLFAMYCVYFLVSYHGLIPYVEQDLQTADNNKKEILLLLYLPIVAIPALGHITIITVLMVGEESKT